MKTLLLAIACLGFLAARLPAGESWMEALRQMPLPAGTPPLNRDNAMRALLDAFASNATVKALIFLPAVSDDFYLFNRDRPKLNITARHFLDAITALTNATPVRATFRAPFLLLHLERDFLEPICSTQDDPAAGRLKAKSGLAHAHFIDTHWERLQPALQKSVTMKVRPDAQSEDAWHFSRHNLAGWNLSNWELLQALSLAGKTACTVRRDQIVFAEHHSP